MERWTRRKFLTGAAQAAAGTTVLGNACRPGETTGSAEAACGDGRDLVVPLDGTWLYRTDADGRGEAAGWNGTDTVDAGGWEEVPVPSTWQVAPKTVDYMGSAWYRREFAAPDAWKRLVVRIEFEAVFHTAEVFVNGRKAGEHVGKGYTAFAFDISGLLAFGARNVIAVRVDNAFAPAMLPWSASYDWTPDGGITRPVRLIVTPPVYIERLWVDAVPELPAGPTGLSVTAVVRNTTARAVRVGLHHLLKEEASGATLQKDGSPIEETVPAGTAREVRFADRRTDVLSKLWHFDHPHLYAIEASISRNGRILHRTETTFGVRRIEVRGTEILLNGEPVRLAGVERMGGSHPGFGMAEPASWIEHDHADMKELNCVLTRVHWQQDRRVLDYCDRHGLLIQVEVPTWGPDTFAKPGPEEIERIKANGLEQLRETVARDRNHPCVLSWGLCNEVDGQNPVAQSFVRAMLREAKCLDPGRLCSYASNSLQATPERDVAGEMDFVEWNEYYESWFGGDVGTLQRNLEAIHRAFPDKPVVISEYGYCACTADRPEDDARRAEILRTHNAVFRRFPWVGGLIFFDYNDYRTHIGDKGTGVLKQRVHGVVDVFGVRKPSFEALREESSPVEAVTVRTEGAVRTAVVRTRRTVPAYTLRGYTLRWTAYGNGAIPIERGESPLPDLAPGAEASVRFAPHSPDVRAIRVEIVRPTGFSVAAVRV